ncbi:SDR family oxidoreductase [Brevibacterium daeguense]|nr:hypothetical protein [Brevibacterium daeguense]
MQITVLGATGVLGHQLVENLVNRGHAVVEAHRSGGVDAYRDHGLQEAVAGSDWVVDCLNLQTLSPGRAVDFFTTTAHHIAEAARTSGARVAVVSIVGAANPALHRSLGYYKGKAAQESVYHDEVPPERLLMFRSTQWFELVETLLNQTSLGPIAAVPHMRVQPLAVADAAGFLADAIEQNHSGDRAVAGPDVRDMAELAAQVAAVRAKRTLVIPITLGRVLRQNLLLPDDGALIGTTSWADWLAEFRAAQSR